MENPSLSKFNFLSQQLNHLTTVAHIHLAMATKPPQFIKASFILCQYFYIIISWNLYYTYKKILYCLKFKHKVRVRADILRSLVMKNNKPDPVEMSVAPFSSRPVLHIKDMVGSRPPYALTFADTITRYVSNLVDDDLAEAYMRAGPHFDRQMRQTFVVLEEASYVRKNLSQAWRKGTNLVSVEEVV